MHLALTENRPTLHRTKTQRRRAGKAGIPGERVVYTRLSRGLDAERPRDRDGGQKEGGGSGGPQEMMGVIVSRSGKDEGNRTKDG